MDWVWVETECGGCGEDFAIQVPDMEDFEFVIKPLCHACQDDAAIEMSNFLYGGDGS